MKLSQIINYPLGLLGWKIVRKDRLKFINNSDIQQDKQFLAIYRQIEKYTLVPFERCYALYQAVQYIIRNNIQGDFAECGVWRGGSCMLIARTLQASGITNRKIYLYDTFAGMPEPGPHDGETEKDEWQRLQATPGRMCFAPIEDVKSNLASTGYPAGNFILVKGKVEETIPGTVPAAISLLRLDTDWYESTRHELLHLYPLLVKSGVLIVDDYGAWQGARKAVDEYFSAFPAVFLGRIDYTGRIVIK